MKVNFLQVIYLILIPLMGFPQNQESKNVYNIRITFDNRLLHNINNNDAELALDSWTNALIKKFDASQQNDSSNVIVVSNVCFTDKMELVLQDLKGYRHEVVNVLSVDYLPYHKTGIWEPIIVSANSDHFPDQYLILTRKDSQLNRIEDLRSKVILMPIDSEYRMSSLWVENLLLSQFNQLQNQYFKNIEPVDKASEAVLDLFFKKADACVVTSSVFQTMKELNPQIATKLQIIEISPTFIQGMTCIRSDMDQQAKTAITDVLKSLPETVTGRQVLTLFGKTRVYNFKEKYLDNIYNLVSTNQMLRKKYYEK